jgi:hypothetical protein
MNEYFVLMKCNMREVYEQTPFFFSLLRIYNVLSLCHLKCVSSKVPLCLRFSLEVIGVSPQLTVVLLPILVMVLSWLERSKG